MEEMEGWKSSSQCVVFGEIPVYSLFLPELSSLVRNIIPFCVVMVSDVSIPQRKAYKVCWASCRFFPVNLMSTV